MHHAFSRNKAQEPRRGAGRRPRGGRRRREGLSGFFCRNVSLPEISREVGAVGASASGARPRLFDRAGCGHQGLLAAPRRTSGVWLCRPTGGRLRSSRREQIRGHPRFHNRPRRDQSSNRGAIRYPFCRCGPPGNRRTPHATRTLSIARLSLNAGCFLTNMRLRTVRNFTHRIGRNSDR